MTKNFLKKNNMLKLIIPMLCLIGVLYAGIIYINADTTGYDPVSNKYNGEDCVESHDLGEVTEYYFEADRSILVLKSNIDTAQDSRATFTTGYNGKTTIKKVIIAGDLYFNNSNPDIGIFTNCANLESVDFSTYGSFSTNIVNDTFNGCSNLISVDLTNFYLENSVTTIRSMFFGCSQIEEINLGTHFDTSNIGSMWALFNGCTNLQSVDLGTNFTLKGIATNDGIGDIFSGCTSLSKVKVGNLKANEDNTNTYKSDKTLFTTIIPKTTITELDLSTGYNTELLTNFNSMFAGYTSLTKLDLGSNFDTSRATQMWHTFYQCKAPKINLGNKFDTSNVNNTMAEMFRECSNLTELDLGDKFDTSNVTNIWAMFYGCTNLQTLDLGNNFSVDKSLELTDKLHEVIGGCPNLTTIKVGVKSPVDRDLKLFTNIIPAGIGVLDLRNGFNTTTLTTMDGMFDRFTNLTELYLGDQFTPIAGCKINELFKRLINLEILDLGKNFDTTGFTDMSNMFYNHPNLQVLNLGEKFDTSSVKNMQKMFGSIGLPSLTLPATFDTSNVTNMKEMFSGSSMTILNLGPNFDTSNVTNMNSMFQNMSSLKEIKFGNKFNTINVTDMNNMFSYCKELEELTLPSTFNASNTLYMISMFDNCKKLKKLDFNNNIIGNSALDMAYMFYNCNALEEIKLGSNFNTSNVTNMIQMFYFCSSLHSLTLPSTFNTSNVTNMYQMFYSNQSLKELDLGPNFDTSNVTEMQGLFNDCKSLTKLDLGDKFDTSKCTNTSFMFCNMLNLTSLDLGDKFNTHNVVTMLSMFNALNVIQELDLGDKFDTSSCQSFQNMFSSCFKLKKLDLGDKFDTSKASYINYTDGLQNMFGHCYDLKELKLGNKIVIPENVKAGAMFERLDNLTTLDLSNVTITEDSLPNSFGATETGYYFAQDSKIDNLILGTKITSFGKNSSGPLTKNLFLTGTANNEADIKPMNIYLTYADGDTDSAHLEDLKRLVRSYDWKNDNRQIINIPTLYEIYHFEYAPGTYNTVTALADLNVYYYDPATSKYVKVPNSELTYVWINRYGTPLLETSNTLTLENKDDNTGLYTCEVSYGESKYTMKKFICFLPSNDAKFMDANTLEDKVYTGSKVDINLVVTEKGTENVLTKGTDYELYYGTEEDMYNLTPYYEGTNDTEEYLTNAGEKTIWIQGTFSNYFGLIPRSFKILPSITYIEDAEIKDDEELIQKVHATLENSDALDIPAGNEIEFEVKTEESILDPVDEKAVDNKAKKNDNIKKIGSYDINVECNVDGSPADLSIKENKKIKLQLTIPVDKNANLDYKTLKVYHLLSTNGNIEELNVSNIDERNNLVSFNIETGSFSNFILYASKKANNNDTPGGNIPSNITTQTITVAIIDHKKVIEGYEDKTFKPNNNITLQEVAALLARTSTDYNDKVDYTTYLENANIKDVPNSLWGKNYLGYMVLNGFMEKDSKGNLNPQKNATREEVVKIICKYKNLDVTNKTTTLIDVNNETANYAGALEELGFIEGYADKSFKGDKNITRAEFAKLLCKLLNREITNPNRITNSMKNELKIYLSDLNENSWYYPYIFELSYDHSKQFLHNN